MISSSIRQRSWDCIDPIAAPLQKAFQNAAMLKHTVAITVTECPNRPRGNRRTQTRLGDAEVVVPFPCRSVSATLLRLPCSKIST